MPIDTRRLSEQEFSSRLVQSEETLPGAGKDDNSGKSGKAGKTQHSGTNLTVEHVGGTASLGATSPSQGVGASQPAQVELPAPTVDPAVMMMLVQSLQSKTSANQETASGNQLAISHQKMTDSISKYEDNIKKEAEDAKKAHHKKSVGEWISGAVDAVEFVAGAALVATGVGTVAGVALMATAVVNAVDLGIQADPHASDKLKKDMGIITIAADVTIGVATLGVGIGAGLLEAGAEVGTDALEGGIEMSDMSTEAGDEVPDDEMPDDESDVDDSSDESGDDVDSPEENEGGLKQLEKMFDKELEEQFSENFAEDTTEDVGDNGDDDGKGMKQYRKGQIVKAAVKATFGMYAKGAGIAGAGTGAVSTWSKVEQHELAKKMLDFESQAADTQKGEQEATAQIQSVIGQLQSQLDEYEKISESVAEVLQNYNGTMTDTGIQGFA
jgi:hypothetical protein